MAIQKTEAFVLKTQPFRTSSLLVTTFTRTFGKIKGVVKGVRREGMTHPSTFEPFTRLEIVYYEKIRSDIHLISEASILETYDPLRSDLETLAVAYYFSELVDQLSEAHDPHEPIFELLSFAFQFLPTLPLPFLVRFFEVRLLHEAGLLPHLTGCLKCGRENSDPSFFSLRQGAVVCQKCRKNFPEARKVSREMLEAMNGLMNDPVNRAGGQSLEGRVEKEIGDFIDGYLTDRIGRRLPSRRFLSQVRSLKSRLRQPRNVAG